MENGDKYRAVIEMGQISYGSLYTANKFEKKWMQSRKVADAQIRTIELIMIWYLLWIKCGLELKRNFT